jgi:hypothetical protein
VYWYHGSKKSLSTLRKQKACAPPSRPPEEGLEAVYLTPSFAFALGCAARPPGITEMDLERWTIRFGNPDKFEPDEPIYIYLVDPAKIPDEAIVWVDQWQVAVTMDEVKPDKVEVYKAGDVFRYYHYVEESC